MKNKESIKEKERRNEKREIELKKAFALSQIFTFILSSFAFAFILGGMIVFASGGILN